MADRPARIFLSPPEISAADRAAVMAAFDSGYVAPVGPCITQFETAFCQRFDFAAAAALSSGTAAMHIGLRLLGVLPGDAVILPSLTFIGGVAPAVQLGAEPVFVDCEAAGWGPDPMRVEEALVTLRREGRRVGAVVTVDLYGAPCALSAIRAVCAAHDVPVLADAAEAVGATQPDGRAAGKGTALAAFSFNGNKIITTSGGGMLAGDDPEVIARARHLATQARAPTVHYEHHELGYNYRLSNLLAGLGLSQLADLDRRVVRRRALFAGYRQRLADLPGIDFAPAAPHGTSNRWLTVLQLDPRHWPDGPERLRLALEAENIEARPVWQPMHRQPVFKDARCFGGVVAERLFARGLCLPSGSALTDSDLDRICGIIRKAAGR